MTFEIYNFTRSHRDKMEQGRHHMGRYTKLATPGCRSRDTGGHRSLRKVVRSRAIVEI